MYPYPIKNQLFMPSLLLVQNPALRDALVNVFGATKYYESHGITFYQKQGYILAFSLTHTVRDLFKYSRDEYSPERIFFVIPSRSIDTEHEIGDIILPNVFLSYNKALNTTVVTEKNRDLLMGKAHFFEIFTEQKDYYVENYGLSLGGIIVDNTPQDMDSEILMNVYSADAYTNQSLAGIRECMNENAVPTMLIVGITE